MSDATLESAPLSVSLGARRLLSRQAISDGVHPLVTVVAVTVVGMAYTLLWAPVVRHASGWVIPGDMWGTFRDAHIIGWGGEGILYASNVVPMTGYIGFPAMPVVLAPVAMLSGALHLTESLPLALPHPTAWILLGPVEMAAGASVLFPLDALAGRLGVAPRRRIVVLWAEAALVWPVVAVWGHPEDLVALGLGICGLMSALDTRWGRSALLVGLAIAFQPLAFLMFPIVIAVVSRKRWLAFAGLAVAPSAALLLAPLGHAWRTTFDAIVDQPTYPFVNHPTPWVGLARVLHRGHPTIGLPQYLVPSGAPLSHDAVTTVAGGPSRAIAVLLAIAVGAGIARRHPSEFTVWWLGAVALAMRCVFEPVMTPYYAAPALALALVLAARLRWMRFALAVSACAICTWLGYLHSEPWLYYLPVTAALLLTVALGRRWGRRSGLGIRMLTGVVSRGRGPDRSSGEPGIYPSTPSPA